MQLVFCIIDGHKPNKCIESDARTSHRSCEVVRPLEDLERFTRMKLIFLLFFAVSSLFAQMQETIRTVHGPNLSIKIQSDTTFFITDNKAIRFRFIDEALYKTHRSIYKKSVLNNAHCTDLDDYELCKSVIANVRLTQYRE